MEIWISALTLGLLGSFHCIGMCGPIAIALPLNNRNWFLRVSGALLYNIGSAFTYAFMGALFGFLGKGLVLTGLQQWVSILMGIIMVLSVVFPYIGKMSQPLNHLSFKLTVPIKKPLSQLFQKRSAYSLFLIGLLNGFLPCGLVYIALAGAVATGDMLLGAVYMFLFGLATLPVMFLLNMAGNMVSLRFRNLIRRIIPVFIVIIGLLFILRGMNLGIKYISPKLEKKAETTQMNCCN